MACVTLQALVGTQQSLHIGAPDNGSSCCSGGRASNVFPVMKPLEYKQAADMELVAYSESPWSGATYTSFWQEGSIGICNKVPDFKWMEDWFASGLLQERVSLEEEEERVHEGILFDGEPSPCVRSELQKSLNKTTYLARRLDGHLDALNTSSNENQIVDNFFDIPFQERLGTSEEPLLVDNYLWSIQQCRKHKDIQHARLMHAYICSHGLEYHTAVGNHIVPMFVDCGSVDIAQQVFNRFLCQSEHAWTSLISGFSECGQWHHCLILHERMQELCVSPTSHTYVALLKACGKHKDVKKGREVHGEIAQIGCEQHSLVGNTLVSMYAKCGFLEDAQRVFDQLPDLNFVSWNALIAGYVEHGLDEEALNVFQQMHTERVSPSDGTFACVLKACGSLGAVEIGRIVHAEIVEGGFEKEVSVGNSLVGMYAKYGSMSEAQEVFEKLLVQDVVSWTALLVGYVEHGPAQEGLKAFEQMQLKGISPNQQTYACVFKAYGILGALCKGRELHTQVSERGFARCSSVCNSLISMYANCGSISEALEVFEGLSSRDVITWSSMIKGLAMNHKGIMAIHYFDDMLKQGVYPNSITFSSLFKACSHASLMSEGSKYFKLMAEVYNVEPSREHYTSMIDMLSKAGHLYEAERFMEMLCPSSEGAWTALLTACRTYGEVELAWRCFQHLILINPEDSSWYLLMTDVCASTDWSLNCASQIEHLRIHAGATNRPGIATIEVNKQVHQFVGGNDQSEEVVRMLKDVSLRMKDQGHVPNLDLVLGPISEEKKEARLCEHAERFAIAFGLVNTPQGETLRVTKNLRMCSDCHNVSKLISRTERREIIIRDNCCVHQFKDGFCDCGDMY